jgi:hypothetical protein
MTDGHGSYAVVREFERRETRFESLDPNLDVSDKIEHPFTFIGRRQWINRRSGLPKAIKNSRLHSILPVFLIRPRLSLGTFVGNVNLASRLSNLAFRSTLRKHAAASCATPIGHWSSVISHQSSVISHQSSVIGHRSLVIGHWSLVIGHCGPRVAPSRRPGRVGSSLCLETRRGAAGPFRGGTRSS